MSNSGNQISPERTVVTIAEAAQIASCDQFELLRTAVLQKIPVFLSVPQGVEVYSIDNRIIGLENVDQESLKMKLERDRLIGIRPIRCPDIEYLVLAPEDCTRILERGVIRKSVFYSAIEKSNLEFIKPPLNTEQTFFGINPISLPLYQCFATGSKAKQVDDQNTTRNFINNELEIRIENLSIRISDVKTNIKVNVNPSSAPEVTPCILEIKSRQSSSRRLLVLRRAAEKFWEPIYPDDGETDYPLENDIIKYFTESKIAEFSDTLAKRGASFIRPEYAKGKPDKAAQANRQSYISKELKILISVSEELFLDAPGNRPSKTSIAEKLIGIGLKGYKAEAGAAIIYPDDDEGEFE